MCVPVGRGGCSLSSLRDPFLVPQSVTSKNFPKIHLKFPKLQGPDLQVQLLHPQILFFREGLAGKPARAVSCRIHGPQGILRSMLQGFVQVGPLAEGRVGNLGCSQFQLTSGMRSSSCIRKEFPCSSSPSQHLPCAASRAGSSERKGGDQKDSEFQGIPKWSFSSSSRTRWIFLFIKSTDSN